MASAGVGSASQPAGSVSTALGLLPRRLDTTAFRRLYAQMEQQFPDPKDSSTIDALVRMRLLVADGFDGKKAARLVNLAKKNSNQHPENADYRETYGAALYRAGRSKEAVAQLTQAFRIAVLKGRTYIAPGEVYNRWAGATVWQKCFLAMAHHRLGNKAEAREWLQKAVQQIEKTKNPSWETWLQHSLLRSEAEEVLRSR
jgi:tetratricopeptide (TPR) repeat protein